MVSAFLEIFDLLTTTPGNLAFHLIIAFTIGGSLLSAIAQVRKSDYPQSRRLVTALVLLLIVRILYFFIAGAFWSSAIDNPFMLATIERSLTIISTLIILWIWVFPESLQNTDFFTGMLALLTIIFAAFSIMQWGYWAGDESFNTHWLDIVWGTTAIIIILVGEILLIRRRPNLWEYGFALAAILFIGHLIHLIFPITESDFPGAVRLAQLVAFPLLFVLPGRFAVPSHIEPPVLEDRKPFGERRKFSTDLKTFEALLSLASETNPTIIYQYITQSISHALMADICLLISAPEESGQMEIHCGYDLIREKTFQGAPVGSKQLPDVADALRKNRQIQLPDSSTSPDLAGLEHYLGISHAGSTLVYPLTSQTGESLGGLMLLSPYTHREWSDQTQEYLAILGYNVARILERNADGYPPEVDIDELEIRIENLQSEIERVLAENNEVLLSMNVLQDEKDDLLKQIATAADSYETLMQANEQLIEELELAKGSRSDVTLDEVQNLLNELESIRLENENLRADIEQHIRENEQLSALLEVFGPPERDEDVDEAPEDLADVVASDEIEIEGETSEQFTPDERLRELEIRHEEAQKVITHLVREIDSLQDRLQSSVLEPVDSEDVQSDEAMYIELRAAIEEIQRLRDLIAEQGPGLEELGIPQSDEGDTLFDPHAINELSQQINQSILAIEQGLNKVLTTPGDVLESPQRISLIQAQSATGEIKSILDDLTFVSMFQMGEIDLSLGEVDLSPIIDKAIDDIGADFRRKNIALRFDMPEDLPKIISDTQTLQQIVKYLLINACKVSPVEGEVSLKVELTDDQHLLIEVADSGGGIFPDDIPLVFNRLYDIESPPVPGIADKGIGLSLTKSMVEALKGTIEVESVIGDGSTFRVKLPIDADQSSGMSL